MPTVILRPDSSTSQTGWPSADISTTINDNNTSTGVTQNSFNCNFTGTLDDLDGSLSGATINSFTISANAEAGRTGATSASLSLVHATDGIFATEIENWTSTQNTQTTTAFTTQQDGSSALTFAYINDCSVNIIPASNGITLYELFVTVDYTEAASGYSHDIMGLAAASIGKVNTVATANVGKISGT